MPPGTSPGTGPVIVVAELVECANCGGAGVIDTSPPAVFRAPWLASDAPCPECNGTGEVPAHLYAEPVEEPPFPDPQDGDPWGP